MHFKGHLSIYHEGASCGNGVPLQASLLGPFTSEAGAVNVVLFTSHDFNGLVGIQQCDMNHINHGKGHVSPRSPTNKKKASHDFGVLFY